MHLSLVPKRTFDFTVFATAIAIPEDTHRATVEDYVAPAPSGLREFCHVLTAWEEDGAAVSPSEGWALALSDLEEDKALSVVPLVNNHFARSKVAEAFAAWQARRPGRGAWRLVVEDAAMLDGSRASAGLLIGMELITAQRGRRHVR